METIIKGALQICENVINGAFKWMGASYSWQIAP